MPGSLQTGIVNQLTVSCITLWLSVVDLRYH